MTNQPYNRISMLTCVYLICIGAILLLLVMVNSDYEYKNINWTNDNYYGYTKWLVWQLLCQYQILNISSQHMDTGSSVLESCHCGGYVYHKWWHHLIIKHTWYVINGTNKIFQNPGAKTCSVILCVDTLPHISQSHNLCDRYPNISRSCIDSQCQWNCYSD